MPQSRVLEIAAVLGVSDDTVRRWIGTGHLDATPDERGRKVVDGASAAQLACARARPVTDPSQVGRSARNTFVGLVLEVHCDTVMSRVELLCGTNRIEAVMSTEAVRELALEPGSIAVAVVKATQVLIEPVALHR